MPPSVQSDQSVGPAGGGVLKAAGTHPAADAGRALTSRRSGFVLVLLTFAPHPVKNEKHKAATEEVGLCGAAWGCVERRGRRAAGVDGGGGSSGPVHQTPF